MEPTVTVRLLFPEQGLQVAELRAILDEFYDLVETMEGLTQAYAEDAVEECCLVEDILKSNHIPYDLWMADDISTSCQYYRPGEVKEQTVIEQNWLMPSIQPEDLIDILVKTPDAQLRRVLSDKLQEIYTNPIDPIENYISTASSEQPSESRVH